MVFILYGDDEVIPASVVERRVAVVSVLYCGAGDDRILSIRIGDVFAGSVSVRYGRIESGVDGIVGRGRVVAIARDAGRINTIGHRVNEVFLIDIAFTVVHFYGVLNQRIADSVVVFILISAAEFCGERSAANIGIRYG